MIYFAPHLIPDRLINGDQCFSRDKEFRLRLRRWWVGRPERWAAWLMLNPSHAGTKPGRPDDRTVERVIHFTHYWGYHGCVVVNLYPFRRGTPEEMWDWQTTERANHSKDGTDWYASKYMQDNLAQIEEAGRRSCLRVVAFGTDIRDPNWAKRCIERFERPFDFPHSGLEFKEACHCLKFRQKYFPAHPNPRPMHHISDNEREKLWRPRPRILSV
jgi:hypothetical protein